MLLKYPVDIYKVQNIKVWNIGLLHTFNVYCRCNYTATYITWMLKNLTGMLRA